MFPHTHTFPLCFIELYHECALVPIIIATTLFRYALKSILISSGHTNVIWRVELALIYVDSDYLIIDDLVGIVAFLRPSTN